MFADAGPSHDMAGSKNEMMGFHAAVVDEHNASGRVPGRHSESYSLEPSTQMKD